MRMFIANLFFMLAEDAAVQCETECTASSITASSTFARADGEHKII